ncbi:MAG TPA: acyltransferase [Candidatus Dormibacteraeota bacterium]|nr:acyltransferase [Candidatus Dormibacteraeota bacterium]
MDKPLREPLLRPVMPELDAVRGIAILGVVFYHGFVWVRDLSVYTGLQRKFFLVLTAGQFGVPLFFVLSGFLITGILLDSRTRPDYYKRFYLRRALRILPVYYLVLLILVIVGRSNGTFLVLSLVFSSNLTSLFGATMSYAVLWSLAVEEHFYLLWPSAVRRISDTHLMILALVISVISPLLRYICHLHASAMHVIDYGCAFYTWNVADGLAWGAFLALAIRALKFDRIRVLQLSIALFAAAFSLIAIGLPFGITSRKTPLGEALQSVPWTLSFTGLIAAFLLIGTSSWKKLAAPSILQFFGWISYGLYMYHLLVFETYSRVMYWLAPHFISRLSPWQEVWLRFIIAGGAAVGISYLSRRYFEQFFLDFKKRYTPRTAETLIRPRETLG